jgi:cytochrome P450
MNTLTQPPSTEAAISRVVPQLPGVPLLGNALQFRADTIGTLERGWREHGDLFEIRLGGRKLMIASSPGIAQDILIRGASTFRRPDQINGGTLLSLALGDSMLTTDGESWLARRRLMQPVFHRQRIQAMGDAMVHAGRRMLARWDKFGDDATIDLVAEMKQVTLDIINQTMFGTDVTSDADTVGHQVDAMLAFMAAFARNPVRLPLSWPTPANRRFLHARGVIEAYLDRVIRARRASAERRGDLLDMLLDARDEETGAAMTDVQVRNEVATIFAAGHETTALALTWTWHALNHNPQALRALRAEIDSVLGGREPTMADLPNLPYTLAVLEESMRLYPPVPFTVRKAYAPARLGPFEVEAGRLIGISINNIHRHPDFWPDAHRFDPERFLPANKSALRREAYMPFLIGGHMCIGLNFALMEGQLLLAMMAQHFDIRELPNQKIDKRVTITMRPAAGLAMRVAKR